jgi:F-type H+-transporting ATPase subunit a
VNGALTVQPSPAASTQQSQPAQAAEPEHHGLSQKAEEVGRVLNCPITNSMIVTWVVAVALILFTQLATRKMKQVPSGAQNFVEWLVEGLYKFLSGIIGPNLVDRTYWFFATIFIFILAANWMGLIPGIGSIGWGHQSSHGFKIAHPLLRGANADVNMTFAMNAGRKSPRDWTTRRRAQRASPRLSSNAARYCGRPTKKPRG